MPADMPRLERDAPDAPRPHPYRMDVETSTSEGGDKTPPTSPTTGAAPVRVPHPPNTPPPGVGFRGKATTLAGSPSGSGDTFRRSPQSLAADASDFQRMRRLRELLCAPETRRSWYWLNDFANAGADERTIKWGDSALAGTMVKLVWDAEFMTYYFGTWMPDFTVRRYYIDPDGGNPVYQWLKRAVRYYIIRQGQLVGRPQELRRPTNMPAEYFETWMLDPI